MAYALDAAAIGRRAPRTIPRHTFATEALAAVY
jgi:hypothetical protein